MRFHELCILFVLASTAKGHEASTMQASSDVFIVVQRKGMGAWHTDDEIRCLCNYVAVALSLGGKSNTDAERLQ